MLFAVLFIRTVKYVLRMFSIIPACALCDVLSAVFFVRAVEYTLSIASSFDAAHFFGTCTTPRTSIGTTFRTSTSTALRTSFRITLHNIVQIYIRSPS